MKHSDTSDSLLSSNDLSLLTLSELRESLKLRGIDMGLSTLSEFIKTGDIAEQLRVGGKGNRLEFHPQTVDVLAAFLPQYRKAKGRLPQAAAILRAFLKQDESSALIPVSDFLESPKGATLTQYGDEGLRLLSEIVETLKKAVPPDDALLTADQAAAILSCSARSVRRRVLPVLRGRYRKSDVMRYIATLSPASRP
jgi:hypothetical protein